MENLNIVICGSRSITDEEKVFKIIDSVLQDLKIGTIITGGSKGVDEIAKAWAEKKGLPHQEMNADWETFGKAAGPIRNKEMAIRGNATLAIVDDKSVGTWNMIENAVTWKHVNITIFLWNKKMKLEFIEKLK